MFIIISLYTSQSYKYRIFLSQRTSPNHHPVVPSVKTKQPIYWTKYESLFYGIYLWIEHLAYCTHLSFDSFIIRVTRKKERGREQKKERSANHRTTAGGKFIRAPFSPLLSYPLFSSSPILHVVPRRKECGPPVVRHFLRHEIQFRPIPRRLLTALLRSPSCHGSAMDYESTSFGQASEHGLQYVQSLSEYLRGISRGGVQRILAQSVFRRM